MPPPKDPAVVRFVRAALGPNADGTADAILLARFADARDEAAFELLVWRHAGMVLRVCQATLRDCHAAEDATQATFLALARQASSAGRRGAVAGWLYRVARRVAARAAWRRRKQLAAVSDHLDRLPAPASDRDPDAAQVLHDELDRLPDKYRAPVLLCFFEGLTHAEAARRLGLPVGTVNAQVARAKDRLHRRLVARGVVTPTVLAALVASDAIALPPSFVASTSHAAVAFAAGSATVPGVSITVLELAKGAIKAMILTKLQWAAGVAVTCGTLTLGGVWAGGRGPARPGVADTPDEPRAAVATPAERTVTRSQRQRSFNHLKQIGLAFHNHHDATGRLPGDIRSKDGKPLLSWRVALLPYLEQAALFNQFKADEPWDSEHNLKLLSRMPDVYRVEIEPKDATHTYYQVFAGPGTPFGPKSGGRGTIRPGMGGTFGQPGAGQPATTPGFEDFRGQPGTAPAPDMADRFRVAFTDITDGTSNTLGVVEAGPPVPWTKPADIPYDPKKPVTKLDGPFADVLHASTLDGAAHALRRDIDPAVMRLLVEMGDGQVIPDLGKLRASVPAVTPQDRELLRRLLGEKTRLAEEVARLTHEHLELTGDVAAVQEEVDRLRAVADDLREKNKKLRERRGKE